MTDEEFYARRRQLEERERWALALVEGIRRQLTDLMNQKLNDMLAEELEEIKKTILLDLP